MMKVAVAIAAAWISTVALAADQPPAAGSQGASSGNTTTAGPGKASAQGAGDIYLAKEFWDKNAKGGYLSKADVGRFKGADGKSVDLQKIDMDNDGRISEREWTTYHETAGAAGTSARSASAPQTGNR